MCRPLTVTCCRRVAGIDISDHFLTFDNLKVPCKNPGSKECRERTAELIEFQNPPTVCAGLANGALINDELRRKCCMKALDKYGRALHRGNFGTPAPWWKFWSK